MTYVCITGNENDPRALQDRLERVLRTHSRLLCELRLDYLDLSPGTVFSFLAKLPSEWAPRLVLTQRLRASGMTAQGRCGWDLPTWQSWWKDVMSLRPWFAVDLDWIVLDRLAGEGLSWQGKFSGRHAFFSLHGSLDELSDLSPELAASARMHGAGVKIAAPVGGPTDMMRLLSISESMGDFPLKTVVAMGAAGKAWRWSSLAGSLSYFGADESVFTAPGQDSLLNVLPYLEQRRRPDLYLLWSTDPENRKGEQRWNELFRSRGTHARYMNVPCSTDVPTNPAEELLWARDAFAWMERAGVKGASVTRPFKRIFALALGKENSAINTIQYQNSKWNSLNTDGEAVSGILADFGLAKEHVAILGGGGAAQAVETYLTARGVPVSILRRNEAGEPPAHLKNEKVLISTWPGHNQQLLVEWLKRCAPDSLSLCIDAQFSVPETESPLAEWCASRKIRYIAGAEWWRRQALGQDRFWFSSEERWGKLKAKLLTKVPRSKSMTLRALAIAAIRGGKTVIENPSICDDTAVFRKALEKLGVRILDDENRWIITSSAKLKAPTETVAIGEGAAGFRMLLGLATQIEGTTLKIDAAESLRARPHDEILSYLGITNLHWPLEISLPVLFPETVSSARSSQFATSFLIASAAKARSENRPISLKIQGEIFSEPYLRLTEKMLKSAGFSVSRSGEIWEVSALEPVQWQTEAEFDASAFAFLQVICAKLGLDLPFQSELQGDAAFTEILIRLYKGEKMFSLRETPDLAPPLVAAAMLFKMDLEVRDCPQLKHKETNRIHALVKLAHALGVSAEEKEDGFSISAAKFAFPEELVKIETFSDHRMAMTAGVLGFFSPLIQADNPKCVAKSFPEFWQALQLLQELRP